MQKIMRYVRAGDEACDDAQAVRLIGTGGTVDVRTRNECGGGGRIGINRLGIRGDFNRLFCLCQPKLKMQNRRAP